MLRGEKLTAGFTRVGGVVGDKKFVGIAKQINVIVFKITKVQTSYAVEYCCKTGVSVLYRIAQAVTGGVEICKQALYVLL